MANVVPRLSATPGAVLHAGHAVGQDTHRVLRELLDLDEATLLALERDGVIAGRSAAAVAR